MNVRKFIGSTSRDALREVREALGADAVVLASRSVDGGVEITALAPEALAQLVPTPSTDAPPPLRRNRPPRQAPLPEAPPVVAQAPMSASAPVIEERKPHTEAWAHHLMSEIHALRGSLEGQIAGLAWNEQLRREPVRTQLLGDMLNNGFTPVLARMVTDALPAGHGAADALQWAQKVVARNLSMADEDQCVLRGGVYALVGPTGVGKTTTTAKLAARCVVRHGADKLALLTTDSYRIGGHEQLRIYGKILGVPVHVVRDTDDLRTRLEELKRKHMVLIDTVGMSQRDAQVPEQSGMLDACGVQRLVLLPATAAAGQLQDVVRAYRGNGLHGAIITKTDEAITLAGALDVVMRYKLAVHYVADGQRVPEDLHPAQRSQLAEAALSPVTAGAGLAPAELPLMMTGLNLASAPAPSRAQAGALHA